MACRRKDEEKILHKHNLIILPQLYQTEVFFRSHDQIGQQGTDKVQQRILHRFDWPGLRMAYERWVNACLSWLQVKDPRNRMPVNLLRAYCLRYMTDWDKYLPQVVGAYNSTQHSTTGIMMLTVRERATP